MTTSKFHKAFNISISHKIKILSHYLQSIPQFSNYYRRCQNSDCRKPEPDKFALDNRPASITEKSETDGRYFDGSPGKKESFVTERREQSHARTAVRQHIEKRMRKRGEREKDGELRIGNFNFQKSGGDESDERAEQNAEKYRVRETAMREHRTARHAERIRDDIGVGNHRADGNEKPKPTGNRLLEKRFARNGGEGGV